VLEQYPGKVKLVFKNFPLRNHEFSAQSALAALAAEGQGKFWEFHDLLYKNYSSINKEKIQEIALSLELDMEKFNKDIKDPALRAKVTRDLRDGAQAGVRSTPTVFVNGWQVQDRSLTGLKAQVDKELEKLKPKLK
jgi:protein-disulfide isomerase